MDELVFCLPEKKWMSPARITQACILRPSSPYPNCVPGRQGVQLCPRTPDIFRLDSIKQCLAICAQASQQVDQVGTNDNFPMHKLCHLCVRNRNPCLEEPRKIPSLP